MSDLLASFQISVPPAGPVTTASPRVAAVASVTAALPSADFGTALIELLTAGPVAASDADRQMPATTGNDLPEDDELSDPLLAWNLTLAGAPLPPPDIAASRDAATPAASGDSAPIKADVTAPLRTALAPGDTVPLPLARAAVADPAGARTASAGVSKPVVAGDPPPGASALTTAWPVAADKVTQTRAEPDPPTPAAQLAAAIATAPAMLNPPTGPLPIPTAAAFAPMVAIETAAGQAAPALTAMPMPAPTPVLTVDPGTSVAAAISAKDVALIPTPSRFDALVARDGVVPLGREPAQLPPPFVALQPAPPPTNAGLAAQVFAVAASVLAPKSTPADPVAEPLAIAGLTGTEPPALVKPLSGTAQPQLDMSRNDWPGQLIERIAALRDSAEAADTRIKLAPENLGALEVSIRRDGDRIHVHFTADNPAARQLIADATPRLAELADARGLKLGQASVDGGNAGGSQSGPQRDAREHPHAMHPSSAASRSEPPGDDRIA